MSGRVIHMRAYQAAIFRGSRENPIWDRADIIECERNLRHPAVRERIAELRSRAVFDEPKIARTRMRFVTEPDGGEA